MLGCWKHQHSNTPLLHYSIVPLLHPYLVCFLLRKSPPPREGDAPAEPRVRREPPPPGPRCSCGVGRQRRMGDSLTEGHRRTAKISSSGPPFFILSSYLGGKLIMEHTTWDRKKSGGRAFFILFSCPVGKLNCDTHGITVMKGQTSITPKGALAL